MVKVLFVSSYLARNGTETFMMNVFRNIDRTRFHVDFLCFSREGMAYEDEIVDNGSKVYVMPRRKDGLAYYHSLNSFFKKHQYDVLHWCTCSCTTVAPLYYAWKHHVPVRITHSHNSSCSGLHNRIFHYALKPFLNRLTTERLACSSKAGEWLFGKRKSLIVKNGIDIRKYSYNEQTREKMRDKLGIASHVKVIGHVGRFDPVKNHSFIVDIFARYTEYNHDAILMLIGIGVTKDSVEAKVRQLHLEDNVMFLGERTDVPDLMQAMDLFIMPSLFEGLPYVLVEAQAAGLPCIVSDVVDPQVKLTPHLIFMSLCQSAVDWAHTIDIICMDYDRVKCNHYIKNSGFSIEKTVSLLEEIYLHL